MSSPDAAVDTVVLRYYLLVERVDLLVAVLGAPVALPRLVFDPDDGEAPLAQKSELKQSVERQRQWSLDVTLDDDQRRWHAERTQRLERATELHSCGDLIVAELDDAERQLSSRLTSPSGCKAFGLKFPLHPGEAACVALAVNRNLVLATDDNDALTALKSFGGSRRYTRTRRILMDAVNQGMLTRPEANELHALMTSQGFFDKQLPFPDDEPL